MALFGSTHIISGIFVKDQVELEMQYTGGEQVVLCINLKNVKMCDKLK